MSSFYETVRTLITENEVEKIDSIEVKKVRQGRYCKLYTLKINGERVILHYHYENDNDDMAWFDLKSIKNRKLASYLTLHYDASIKKAKKAVRDWRVLQGLKRDTKEHWGDILTNIGESNSLPRKQFNPKDFDIEILDKKLMSHPNRKDIYVDAYWYNIKINGKKCKYKVEYFSEADRDKKYPYSCHIDNSSVEDDKLKHFISHMPWENFNKLNDLIFKEITHWETESKMKPKTRETWADIIRGIDESIKEEPEIVDYKRELLGNPYPSLPKNIYNDKMFIDYKGKKFVVDQKFSKGTREPMFLGIKVYEIMKNGSKKYYLEGNMNDNYMDGYTFFVRISDREKSLYHSKLRYVYLLGLMNHRDREKLLVKFSMKPGTREHFGDITSEL
jgi:hypothetical protein